jgi:DNA mismatch endonuclease (patch repair protein)
MTDTLSPARRSWLMGRVAAKNTKPEMIVRRAAHGLGCRFRLHRKDLPGRPDLVFPKLRKAIFVHGCFWHRHDCRKATTPKTNAGFWQEKFRQNIERDANALNELADRGWDTLVIWECETADATRLIERLVDFLGPRQ